MSEQDYTFSSLINQLLETEKKLSSLYSLGNLSQDASRSFVQDYKDLAFRLEKTRIESVTEFTLEPIPSSGISRIIERIECVIRDDSLSISQKLIQSEKLNAELLREVSVLVAAISAEANQLLRSASRKAERRIDRLTA